MTHLLIDSFVLKKYTKTAYMTGHVKLGSTVKYVQFFMKKNKVDCLTVIDDTGEIQGIITEKALLNALYLNEKKKRYHQQQQIKHLTDYDALTGLPNLNSIKKVLHKKVQLKTELAIMIINLDGFRNVNDNVGYDICNIILTKVADRLQSCIKEKDGLGKKSNDEFILYLCEIKSKKDISTMAEHLLKILSEPYHIESHSIYLKASIGISRASTREIINENELIDHASAALTYSKSQGNNNYGYYKKNLRGITIKNQIIESHLRDAISCGDLILHYQPQFNTLNNTVFGLEALLRWKNKKLGLVSPNTFIPIAEKTGLIIPLSSWAIHEACRQMKHWSNTEQTTSHISVNISAREFTAMDHKKNNLLVKIINDALEGSQLNPAQLELEITESTLMKNYTESLKIMKELKNIGVRIACDDFGTGYSSLSYLKTLPIDTLKIDKSFIDDLASSTHDRAIIQAILLIAESLNMQIVAEGVETKQQLDILKDLGCHIIQGYYISKPKQIIKFDELIKMSNKS